MLALDLFCGAGGVGLALKRCGFDIVAIDHDIVACRVYQQTIPQARVIQADIRSLPIVCSPDLLWASPPCPPWSEALRLYKVKWGNEHPEGDLLLNMPQVIARLRPRWCIIENVDGLPDKVIAPLVSALREIFPDVGVWRLNAEAWLPQKRGHVFIVAGDCCGIMPIPTEPPKRFRDIIHSDNAVLVKPHQLRYALRKKIMGISLVSHDDCLPTVTTKSYHSRWNCFVMVEDGILRFPTFVEAARAQGLPDLHPLYDLHQQRPSKAWELLGNMVPIPLAEAVIRALLRL